MRTKRILSIVLALVLLASALPLAITSAAAYEKKIPCDADGNNELTKEELVNAILPYMLGEGDLKLDDVGDAAWVYAYWDGKSKTIVDSAGRTVTIYRPLERIVVFNGETVETMRSLRATGKIVGVGKYTIQDKIFFPEFSDFPNVGSVWCPNYEEVLKCEPDAVFLYATCSKSKCDAIQKRLRELDPGITVVRLDCFRPLNYTKEVESLGLLLDREEEAKKLVDFYEGCLDPIYEEVSDIPEENRTKVYIECWHPYHTAGQGAGWHEKIKLVGGDNIFSDLSGYVDVDPEEIAKPERDPEVIIRIARSEGGYDTRDITELSGIWDEFIDPEHPNYYKNHRDVLANTTAVKNGRVYVINTDIFGGARHFIGMEYVTKWLYPNLFSDLYPKTIHKQYITEFQGLDYDLDKHGVFVYHPELHPDGK